MLTQAKADELLAQWKESVREHAFAWERDRRHEELFVTSGEEGIKFCLSLTRNPFELKAHFRTQEKSIGLARIDDQLQHHNPDGSVIRGPHFTGIVKGMSFVGLKPLIGMTLIIPYLRLHDSLMRYMRDLRVDFKEQLHEHSSYA